MHRYQVLIEYVGTNFVGWQIQSKGKSIQKLIQTKISKLLKEKISLVGSGRTDSGVHAIEQSAHFDCKKEIQNLDKLLKSINHFVNDMNISIINIKKKKLRFHARFSAKYFKQPTIDLTCCCKNDLDLNCISIFPLIDFILIDFIVRIGLLALQLEDLNVEKSLVPKSFFAPFCIKKTSSSLIMCHPLSFSIEGLLNRLKIIYL